jgi:hypothetical protein
MEPIVVFAILTGLVIGAALIGYFIVMTGD